MKNVTAVLLLIIISMLPLSAMAEDLPVTSPFGWREDPYTGEWRFHTGVDLGYEYGAGIPALFDGVVADAGDNGDGYGNQVLLYHPQLDALPGRICIWNTLFERRTAAGSMSIRCFCGNKNRRKSQCKRKQPPISG